MKVLDLFSGIGGFSLGLERAGMETVAFCEIDKHCQKVLTKHWPNVPIFEDVRKVRTNLLQEVLRAPVSDIDVVCGGFPCQDISVAGKQKGIKGERSGLWKELCRIIKEVKPKYAIIENVANLRSKGLSTVIKDLWKIGYSCEWHIISASSIGALHKRERIWIIAYPNGPELREQSRWSSGKNGEDKILSGIDGQEGTIRDSSSERCDGCIGEERYLQTNRKRDNTEIQSKGEQCEFITRENGQILSRRSLNDIRDAYSDQWELVSSVHRVVNGLSRELDKARRQRIKQLGNSVVPQIPELIGRELMIYDNSN